MKQTFAVLYYINHSRPTRRGRTTILCRITVCGTQATFSTQLKVSPSQWSQTRQRVRGHTPQSVEANQLLVQLRQRLEGLYLHNLSEGSAPTASALRHDLLSTLRPSPHGLLAQLEEEVERYALRVGNDKARSTYNKYRCVRNHLSSFLADEMEASDIAPAHFSPALFSRFIDYLARHGCSNNTIWIYLMPLRSLLRRAHERGEMDHWHPDDYSFGFQPRQRQHLAADQLARLEGYTPQTPTEERVKEMFLLGCYTGLAYIDICTLRRGDISTLPDGGLAITTLRHKTHTPLHIRLLPQAEAIIRHHLARHSPPTAPLLPTPSNRTCNRTLHKIATRLGLALHLTFHLSRHTFATTITLERGMPIESVSRLLGHKSIKTTQIYATVTNRKLDEDMQRLEATLSTYAGVQNVYTGTVGKSLCSTKSK